jgi:phosphatidylinositol-3-phosphatase
MAPAFRRAVAVAFVLTLVVLAVYVPAQARTDHKAPRVSVTAPTGGQTVAATTALGASASDNVGVVRVEWWVDGAKAASNSSAPWQASWNSASVANGAHTMTAKAFDAAGNVGTAQPVSFSVKNASTPTPSSGVCGSATAPPATYQHVVWIVMENKTYSQIIGSPAAPYINSLAASCGLATNFSAETNPSLPNYIAMTSGSTQGITDDAGPGSHPLAVASIFSQLGSGGWRSLEESMPSNCALSEAPPYSVHHNPAVYYTNIRTQCATQDVPLTATPNISAPFTFITPNTCHDMHDCSVATGDAWLAIFLPRILQSSAYTSGTTAVFLTWDEGSRTAGNHIATIVISPSTPAGTRSGAAFDHYSMLRTTEELLGITSYLGNAAKATSMRTAFHL